MEYFFNLVRINIKSAKPKSKACTKNRKSCRNFISKLTHRLSEVLIFRQLNLLCEFYGFQREKKCNLFKGINRRKHKNVSRLKLLLVNNHLK